jgi:hypothetical protein
VTGTNLHAEKRPGALVVGEIRKRSKGDRETRTTNQLASLRTVMVREEIDDQVSDIKKTYGG